MNFPKASFKKEKEFVLTKRKFLIVHRKEKLLRIPLLSLCLRNLTYILVREWHDLMNSVPDLCVLLPTDKMDIRLVTLLQEGRPFLGPKSGF